MSQITAMPFVKDSTFKIKTTVQFIGEQSQTVHDALSHEDNGNSPAELITFVESTALEVVGVLAKAGIEKIKAGMASGDIAPAPTA